MFFKAEIYMSIEELELNSEGVYEGCNPDSHQDFGIIRELNAPTLAELKAKIEREYFDFAKPIGADVQIFDGRIEISYEGEHDYRTPKEEQIPFIATVSIYITKVEVESVDLNNEELFKNIPQY